MLLKALGWFWVITGITLILKPEWLQFHIKRTSQKTIRVVFFSLSFALGVLLINATWGVSGRLAGSVMILGICGIFEAFFFLKARSAAKVIAWYARQPAGISRLFAVAQIVLGALILTIK